MLLDENAGNEQCHIAYTRTCRQNMESTITSNGKKFYALYTVMSIGADSTGATGNFAPVLTQEPGQTLRFAPVLLMAVL